MRWALDILLRRMIVVGEFSVQWPDGTVSLYRGAEPGGRGAIALKTARAVRGLTLNPGLAFGELYMDGELTITDGTLYDTMELLFVNMARHPTGHWMEWFHAKLLVVLRRLHQYNPASRSRQNVAHHYDLNGRLYSLFLDRDRHYSCAYFPTGDETLEEAQVAKMRHIAAKLLLEQPDLSVLDIGSGWGGLGVALAKDFGARVTGVTLSTEQLGEAEKRAVTEGLDGRVAFRLQDYRAVQGQFDRIVSVGMFEHVGVNHYDEFYQNVARLLKPDGVGLIHAIGRSAGKGATNAWMTKYIFPGGYSPALSEVLPVIERSGLMVTDIEVLQLHYARTLRLWRRRFAANRDAIAALYDDRFCRMFDFYLVGSELAFRRADHVVFQIQVAHAKGVVPETRDYILAAEQRAARAELGRQMGRQIEQDREPFRPALKEAYDDAYRAEVKGSGTKR
jgi:cyclopropane-fatty-acyl-phospholipid synthase